MSEHINGIVGFVLGPSLRQSESGTAIKSEHVRMTCSVRLGARLLVVWSLKEGVPDPFDGWELAPGQGQYCVVHHQDVTFCALGHKPITWVDFLENHAARERVPR